jgi:hypothetical protein
MRSWSGYVVGTGVRGGERRQPVRALHAYPGHRLLKENGEVPGGGYSVEAGRATAPLFKCMAYLDYSSELVGTVPKFSFLLAQKAVNRALREIYESRHWGFLMSEQYLIVPDAVQTGSFAVTQYNNQVQANAAAIAALNNLNNPLITKRQFRAGQSGIYNITAYDNGPG